MNITVKAALFTAALFALVSLVLPGAMAADGPTFHDNFDKARAASKESGRPLIAIFSASWCPPCQQMKKSVYPSKEVRPFHDAFVWAYLDADAETNRPLMTQLKVSGIPHVAFVAVDGQIMGSFAGAVAPTEFARILTQVKAEAGGGTAPASPGGSATKQGSGSKR